MLDSTSSGYPIETRQGAGRYALSLMLFLLISSIAYLPLFRREVATTAGATGA